PWWCVDQSVTGWWYAVGPTCPAREHRDRARRARPRAATPAAPTRARPPGTVGPGAPARGRGRSGRGSGGSCPGPCRRRARRPGRGGDRKSTRLNSSHVSISYAVFCLKKKKKIINKIIRKILYFKYYEKRNTES